MRLLGSDAHGVWLGVAAGTTARRGIEPPVTWERSCVKLLPAGELWWTADFYAEPGEPDIYCDIATPPRWVHPGEVTMVDLDLDVLRHADGPVLLVDEDEFAEHQVRYGYPADVIREAEGAARSLQNAIGSAQEPFGSAYLGWLARLADSSDARI
ncbi:MAG: DUF402 domain-containing protein [Actinobacteria bacterium]|nr:DUF402 domain-containing protein [Actinomycetota bacterium]MBO0835014.1 DUF402 domain-containing protein [Actinomycetota bacterium]